MEEILKEFAAESKGLLVQMAQILETVEDSPEEFKQLHQYYMCVDQIMGGAKTLALDFPGGHPLELMSHFAEVCKVISLKASKISDNESLTNTVTAFMQDATEILEHLSDACADNQPVTVSEMLSSTFLDRLRWLAPKLDGVSGNPAAPVEAAPSAQSDIDALLKQMGL